MNYWIFLHHRCASRYLRAAVSLAGQAADKLTAITALNSFPDPPTPKALRTAMATTRYCLDDNAWPETLTLLDGENNWRGIHFMRDPRDLLVSAYFSHKYSHGLDAVPGLREHREALHATGVEAGLLREMNFYLTEQAIMSVLKWPEHPQVKTFDAIALAGSLAQRDLTMSRFKAAMRWIDIPVSSYFTAPAWEEISGRPVGIEENTHHYRHGVQGDWRRYFTLAVQLAFERRYGAVS